MLFSGNISRFIERALLELAYEHLIHPRPEGWRTPVPIARESDLRTLADVEKALRHTLKFQAALGEALKPRRKSVTAYHMAQATFGDVLTTLRVFPMVPPSLPMASTKPTDESAGERFLVPFSLSEEHYALVVEAAIRLYPSTDGRATAATEGAVGNLTAVVSQAVRNKVDALGLRTPNAEPRFEQFPLPTLAGRYPEEHLRALLVAYRAMGAALASHGWVLPPETQATLQAASVAFTTVLLGLRIEP